MSEQTNLFEKRRSRKGEQGFLLVGVIVMAALILIALSVAAPIVAKDLKREKELEAKHRGEQYVRAIRLFYQKNNSYPASVKALEKTNNVRYLRQHYLDPMTGKDDWRLIGLGQAKTTVKGFFGQPLSGINGAAGGGLGSASNLQSGGVPNTGGTNSSTPGSNTPGSPGGQSSTGTSGFGTSSFGQNGATGGDSAFGAGSTGPFVGVGIPKEGASIITLNEQTDYSTWEFIYDPRIEQLYAKSSIFGGGIATSSGGLGSASSLSGTPGTASPTNPNNPAPVSPNPTPSPNPAPAPQ
jgi:type II secretory pathway pseudopilin PulG